MVTESSKKLCPDYNYFCIQENCVSYSPFVLYPIYDKEIMKAVVENKIAVDRLEYPIMLKIETGYCNKYSTFTDSNNDIIQYFKLIEVKNSIIKKEKDGGK